MTIPTVLRRSSAAVLIVVVAAVLVLSLTLVDAVPAIQAAANGSMVLTVDQSQNVYVNRPDPLGGTQRVAVFDLVQQVQQLEAMLGGVAQNVSGVGARVASLELQHAAEEAAEAAGNYTIGAFGTIRHTVFPNNVVSASCVASNPPEPNCPQNDLNNAKKVHDRIPRFRRLPACTPPPRTRVPSSTHAHRTPRKMRH
jgi:hypothetical protein